MKKVSLLIFVSLILLLAFTSCSIIFGPSEDPKPEHEHEWTEATCEAPKTCATCGDVEGAALGHDWAEATCTAPKTCKTCEKTEGEALGHDWAAADCTTPKTCKTCGETDGAALGHNWDDATCTDPKTCKTCGATEGEAKGHTWSDPTCTAPKTCTACGATEGAALGHTEEVVPGKAATCTATGLTEGKKCSVCGETLVAQEIIPVLDHTEEVVPGKDATCTESGLTEGKKCSVCGETIVAQTEIPKLGHTEETLEAVDATCTSTGLTEGKKCSVCGEILVAQETIPALDHIPMEAGEENRVEPSCKAPGGYDTVVRCFICDGIISSVHTELAQLEHVFGEYVYNNDATCENDGTETATCTLLVCGGVQDTRVKEGTKLGHEMPADAVCGEHWNCVRFDECGYTSPEPLAHDYADATCQVLATCKNCGATTGELAPCVPGAAVEENRVAPQCEVAGSYDLVTYCTVCGAECSREAQTIDATGHKMAPATCDAPSTCENGCGKTEGEAIANHTPVATLFDGVLTYKCTTCDDSFTTEQLITYVGNDKADLFFTKNGDPTVSIVDGAYYIQAGEVRSQYMIYGPSNDRNHPNTMTGWNSTNESFGVFSFRIQLGNITEHVRFIVMSSRNNPNWDANKLPDAGDGWSGNSLDLLSITPNGDGTFEIAGRNITSNTFATVSGDEWVDVKMFMQITTEGLFTVSYYIDGEFMNTYTRDLLDPATTQTIKNLDINNFYICGWTAPGTGFAIDDMYFGYAKNQEWLFDEHEHRWADADCESPKHCTACGLTEGSALGHTEATRNENVVAPDCVNTGSHDVVTYCTVCNKELGRETVVDAALGHTPGEVVIENNVDPTCVLDGKYDEVQYCTVCTKEANRKTVTVPATGHTEVAVPGKDATCTEPGLTEGKVCSVCDATLVAQEVIPAKGHTEEVVPGKDATCTATGLTEGKVCSVCDATLVAQVEIPVVAHTYDNDEDADCNVCGYTRDVACTHENTTTLDAVAATCTATGLTEGKKCNDCGETITAQEVVPALGHLNDITLDAVAATCTATGLTEGVKCSRCEETTTAQVEVPALGHLNDVTIPAVDATCTATGLTAGIKCSRCGETTTAQTEVAALGHSFNNYVKDNNATCLADGTKTSKCDRCDVTDSITDEGTKLDHTPGEAVKENVVAPTCSVKGSHDEVVNCSACGTELSRTTVEDATLAHTWSGAPTCVSGKTCTVCGASDPQLNPNGHNLQATHDGGKLFYACQLCDYRFDVETFVYHDGSNASLPGSNYVGGNSKYNNGTNNYASNGEYVYAITDIDAAVDTDSQMQLWVPGIKDGNGTFKGFSLNNAAVGALSLKTKLSLTNAADAFTLKLVESGWGAAGCIDINLLSFTPVFDANKTTFQGKINVYGYSNVAGDNGQTLLTTLTVDAENWTEWVDIKVMLTMNTETGNLDALYYINGAFVHAGTKKVTTTGQSICSVYANLNAWNKGTGVMLDDIAFGYTAHRHDLVPEVINGVVVYACDCGTTFQLTEYREWNGDGNDSNFSHSANGKWNTVYEDGAFGFMFQPVTESDWKNYNGLGGQMQPWLPDSQRNQHTLPDFSCASNAVGVIAFDIKTSMASCETAQSNLGLGVGKPRNASDWNDGGSWTDDFMTILTISGYNEAGIQVKGGVNSGLQLATIPAAENGWSEWFNVMIVIDLDVDGTMTTYYYINGALTGTDTRNLGTPAADGRYLNPQKIEAFQLSGWTYAAETGVMLDNMYFGYTANGHNTLDGQRHQLTETTCGEKSTCTCGWSGYTVAHTFESACSPVCSECGLANHAPATHASLTTAVVDGKVTYTCSDCNYYYAADNHVLYYDGNSEIGVFAKNGDMVSEVVDGVNHVYLKDTDGNHFAANGDQYMMWVPSQSTPAEFDGFTCANNALGFVSFKINAYTDSSTGIEFKVNDARGTSAFDWSKTSVGIFKIMPVISDSQTTVNITGLNGAALTTLTLPEGSKWTGWLDVVILIKLSDSNMMSVDYYINGQYVGNLTNSMLINTNKISSLYLNGYTKGEGTGYYLDDVAFGYTLGGMHEVIPAEEPIYKNEIAKEEVTNELLTAIVTNKIKQWDQSDDHNVHTGTPVYVVADMNGEDVQALYFSKTTPWVGDEGEQFSEFRFDVDGSKKAASISFDYLAKGTVETNDRYEFTDLEGNKFFADAYVQIKTPATHPGAGDNYPELSGTELTLDGEWHTMTYTFAEPLEIINILFNLYHFQGELLVANLNVTFEA